MPNKKPHILKTAELLNSIETSLTNVSIRTDGIIEIRFKQDEYEVGVKEQFEMRDAITALTENGKKRFHILVIPGKYGGLTKEAREQEMFESESFKKQLSLAIVVNGLHQWIIGNLYIKLKKSKPKYPNKLFNSEESALKWIDKLKKLKK